MVYLLPWSDAIPFGVRCSSSTPGWWFTLPVLPLALLERSVPFGLGSAAVLRLVSGRCSQPERPLLRAFQHAAALLTDIVLVVLGFAFTILLQPLGGSGLLMRTLSSTVVIATLAILLFALASACAAANRTCRNQPGRADAVVLRRTPREIR